MTQREKLYAERDAMGLDEAGNYYIKHVIAMTSERLHSKSAIAGELAHRDMLIDKLTKELQAAKAQAAPQWIPVNDPPKEIGRYWCYVEEQNDIGVSHYQWNCSWNCEEWGSEGLTGVVTHWMPLPSAPEQQK